MPLGSETVRANERFGELDLAEDPMLQLTRIFVYFLQNLFRECPEGQGMKWRPEEENSEIIISDQKPILDAVAKKPHIICVLGGGQWGRLGLDQMQRQNMDTGERTHTDLMSMSVTYDCMSKEGLHARRIAWFASYFTNVYRRVIIKGGRLHDVGTNQGISPESPPTNYTGPAVTEKLVSVSVTVPFYWQPQWIIRKPAEVFRQFSIELGVLPPEASYSAGRAAKLRHARIGGRRVYPSPLQRQEPELTQTVRDSRFVGEE
jgi:hypothetical protein